MTKECLITIDNINKPSIRYIGYYNLLDKIVDLIEKTPHKDRDKLIDKYIEVLKLIKEIEE